MSDHPDFEALSAYHDGEAPEWAGHVAGCAACRARIDEMGAVAGAIRAPVGPPALPADEAIARALDEAEAPNPAHDEVRARRERRRTRVWTAVASVAAVMVAVVGTAGLLRDDDGGTTGDQALTESVPPAAAPEAPTAADSQLGGARDFDGAVLGGELGQVAGEEALVAQVAPTVVAAGMAAGEDTTAAAEAAPGPSGEAAPQRRVIGTRPCEYEARALDPALDDVVYVATATLEGTPVVVLGFTRRGPVPASPALEGRSGPRDPMPVSVMAMTREGCALVFSRPL